MSKRVTRIPTGFGGRSKVINFIGDKIYAIPGDTGGGIQAVEISNRQLQHQFSAEVAQLDSIFVYGDDVLYHSGNTSIRRITSNWTNYEAFSTSSPNSNGFVILNGRNTGRLFGAFIGTAVVASLLGYFPSIVQGGTSTFTQTATAGTPVNWDDWATMYQNDGSVIVNIGYSSTNRKFVTRDEGLTWTQLNQYVIYSSVTRNKYYRNIPTISYLLYSGTGTDGTSTTVDTDLSVLTGIGSGSFSGYVLISDDGFNEYMFISESSTLKVFVYQRAIGDTAWTMLYSSGYTSVGSGATAISSYNGTTVFGMPDGALLMLTDNTAPTPETTDFGTVKNNVVKTGYLTASDTDSDTLVYAVVSQPAHGSISIAYTGSFVYTPDNTYSGADSFVYSVSDGVDTVEQEVTITLVDSSYVANPIAQTLADCVRVELKDSTSEDFTDSEILHHINKAIAWLSEELVYLKSHHVMKSITITDELPIPYDFISLTEKNDYVTLYEGKFHISEDTDDTSFDMKYYYDKGTVSALSDTLPYPSMFSRILCTLATIYAKMTIDENSSAFGEVFADARKQLARIIPANIPSTMRGR